MFLFFFKELQRDVLIVPWGSNDTYFYIISVTSRPLSDREKLPGIALRIHN